MTRIDSGTQDVKAVLLTGYMWSDGTTNDKTISCSINPKTIAVTWGTAEWEYDGSAHSTTASATTGVSGETMTINTSNNQITDVGTQNVTVSCGSVSGGSAKCSNYTLTNTSKSLTINKKQLTIATSY